MMKPTAAVAFLLLSLPLANAQETDLSGLCTQLLNAGFGAVIPEVVGTEESPIECSCDPTLFPELTIALECASAEPVCLPPDTICGTPSIEVELDVTALLGGESPLTFDACFNDVILLGTIPIVEVLGPLCFSLIQTLIETLTGGGGGEDGGNATAPIAAQQQATTTRSCIATLNDQQCTSCTICGAGKGIDFDCSNIESAVVSNGCTGMNLPTKVADVYHPDAIVG